MIVAELDIASMIEKAVAAEKERESNKAFLENTDTPTLEKLVYALRHPETWPEGFRWDFSRCDGCAMGLAHSLWHQKVRFDCTSEMARVFAIPVEKTKDIFLVREKRFGLFPKHYSAVTPEIVAKRIERYLKTRG